jgi:muramoyltetrapeptide carboxypeptidase
MERPTFKPMKASLSTHEETGSLVAPKKPRAVAEGSRVAIFSPASPAEPSRVEKGMEELKRLGFAVEPSSLAANDGYFAASAKDRAQEFLRLLRNESVAAMFAVRGGYGSAYLLDLLDPGVLSSPKCLVGFSDLTSLQIFLWRKCGWIAFYGPLVAAGLCEGASAPNGYDQESLELALRGKKSSWNLNLRGESLVPGKCDGRILGGCLTQVVATLATPWELDTKDSILLLEDLKMKPWQVDRSLMHLKQAGKFTSIRGIILGDFPECEPPSAGSPAVRDVCARILSPLGVPIVFGAAVGHTPRPMLTVPLGVRARLNAGGEGRLEILEPAVIP